MAGIEIVNSSDRDGAKHRYVLWFGACSPSHLMIWADCLEDALDEAADWIENNAPGYFCDDSVTEEYKRALGEGKSEEEAIEEAEGDCTMIGSGQPHYVPSWEWGIDFEDPTRAQVKELIHALER